MWRDGEWAGGKPEVSQRSSLRFWSPLIGRSSVLGEYERSIRIFQAVDVSLFSAHPLLFYSADFIGRNKPSGSFPIG